MSNDSALLLLKFVIAIIHEETQVAEGGWVEGERGERAPFEASLLSSLDHPGICLCNYPVSKLLFVQGL